MYDSPLAQLGKWEIVVQNNFCYKFIGQQNKTQKTFKYICLGSYGEVVYSIRGFGSEKFSVSPTTGEITVASCGIREDTKTNRKIFSFLLIDTFEMESMKEIQHKKRTNHIIKLYNYCILSLLKIHSLLSLFPPSTFFVLHNLHFLYTLIIC